MTDWSARSLLNVVYAYLAEQMDAADRVASPVFLAAGADADEVERQGRRDALDRWLDAPSGQVAAAETAVMKALGA